MLSYVVCEMNVLCEVWCVKMLGVVYVDVMEMFVDVSSFREDGTYLRFEAYDGFCDVIVRVVVEVVVYVLLLLDDVFFLFVMW